LKSTWVGHPVTESGFGAGDGAAFRKRYGIAPGIPVLGLLPGSRRSEVSKLLPVFRDAAMRLAQHHPNLHVVIATTDSVAHEVYTGVRHADAWNLPTTVVMEGAERPAAFAACDIALAASGTVSLELALARVPHVIAYKVNPLSAVAFRMLTKTRFVNLVNVLVGHEAVPERLQGRCRADILADDLAILIRDEPRRVAQAADFSAALSKLAPDGARPSRRAAETILGLMADRAK
jgi:lipid-A-disaccharide synthase